MKNLKLAHPFILAAGIMLMMAAITWIGNPSSVFAQRETGTLQVDPQVDSADPNRSKSLSTRVVMISVLKEGAVVKQKETGMSDVPVNFTLPLGVYDVRVEGEEVTSVTRRGVHVTAGDTTRVLPAMRSGPGVCDCKYSK